jgi:hypothetical protein
MTITRTFYYVSNTKEYDNNVLTNQAIGSNGSRLIPLYADALLTEKIGSMTVDFKLIDNVKLTLDNEMTIVTSEGSFKYKYFRDNYKKITLETEETSGIFTKGTVTRSYGPEDNVKRIRKLVYKSNE